MSGPMLPKTTIHSTQTLPMRIEKDWCSMETVQRAMSQAAERFGGTDGTFNAANFAHAMIEISGVHQTLDGGMVAAILEGRSDVERLSGGAHYRYHGPGKRTQRDMGIESLLTALSEEFDAAIYHHETKGLGGQSCTFTGDFGSVGPGTLARMRRWLRDMRKALGTVIP